MDAAELEKLALRTGVRLAATQITRCSPNIQVFCRNLGETYFSGLRVAGPIGLQWEQRTDSVNFSICCGEARLLLEGKERHCPSVLVYSAPQSAGWAGQLVPARSSPLQNWIFHVSLPLQAGLDMGLPHHFLERSWFEFPLETATAEAFEVWANTQAVAPFFDPEMEAYQVHRWIERLLRPILVKAVKPTAPSPYCQLVREVGEHLAQSNGAVSVSGLAREAKVSTRTLQRAFRSTLGVGVKRYVRLQQLRRAHELLCSGNCTVMGAAHSVGFPHASRFSQEYLDHFGERPSQTLASGAQRNSRVRIFDF